MWVLQKMHETFLCPLQQTCKQMTKNAQNEVQEGKDEGISM
jgi:hypothetical protein